MNTAASSTILRDAGREPTVRVVAYGRDVVTDARVERVAGHLCALAADCAYRAGDVALDRAADLSAPRLARRLAAVFDRVAA